MSNNFLNMDDYDVQQGNYDEVHGDYDAPADDLDDVVNGYARANQVQSEAVLRIQQAKLYETLLAHNFFAPGSANPDIQNKVESEIKEFVVERLEILLGMKQERSQAHLSVFTDEEVNALKLLAARVVGKSTSPVTPTPTVNVVQGPVATKPNQASVNQVQVRQVQPAVQPPHHAQPPQRRGRKPKTNNVGEASGRDLGQAAPTKRKPLPKPTAQQLNDIAAKDAYANARGAQGLTSKISTAIPVEGQSSSGSSAQLGLQLANLLSNQGGNNG